MPNVTIGDNVVIGGGSVVVKDIPSNSVAVGNPCKVIRAITEEDKKLAGIKNRFKAVINRGFITAFLILFLLHQKLFFHSDSL
ncbi:MAG: hypothetical protein ACLT41_07705 [Fusobacterium sp.]|uniref:hypothetical protein n=1 Tax=Fusobacterium sp. TaxID=68766 RepID=UPI003992C299